MNNVHHAFFDLDGTLVDSNDAHAHAFVKALAELGQAKPFEAIRPLIGMGSDNLLPTLLGVEEDSTLGRAIGERKKEIFLEEHFPQLASFPMAVELLATLRKRGVRVTLVSSGSKAEIKKLITKLGLKKHIDEVISADDAEHSKPDPDLIEAALRIWDAPASDVLMIGDTPYDIRAAARADVRTLAFRSGGWDDSELRDALAIYSNPEDLLNRLAESPFFQANPDELSP